MIYPASLSQGSGRPLWRGFRGVAFWLGLSVLGLGGKPCVADDLLDLSLEQLMGLEITSVGKKSQRQSQSAAAVFVVHQDDLRRSGVTSLPDALRMVPGLEVARIDSNKWAVSARGFNGRFANKLLVLIDGRLVYTPSFSGVYWDMQDVMLEDVERIEVIRGPGATLWGANAVNGVINIITKSASDTQGGLVSVGGGSVEQGFGAARYGTKLGESTYARVFAKGFNRASFETTSGTGSGDQWHRGQAGFRVDHHLDGGGLTTLEGDAYTGDIHQRIQQPSLSPPGMAYNQDNARISGFNLLGRWRQPLAADSELSVQAYYSHTYRSEGYFTQTHDLYDLELQHRFALGGGHDVVWGLGYRLNSDHFSMQSQASFGTPDQDRQWFNAFAQDELALVEERLKLTLGCKFEYNEYTGFEGQPNLRLAWTPSDQHTVWGAISRAVRIPSRGEDDGRIMTFVNPGTPQTYGMPVVVRNFGNKRFRSETLLAYELGYRFIPSSAFSADLALFYNDYDQIRSTREVMVPDPANGVVYDDHYFANGYRGESYGAELAMDWKPFPIWRLQLGYTFLKMNLRGDTYGAPGLAQSSPENQVSLRSELSLPHDMAFDLWFRYVDSILSGFPDLRLAQSVNAYATLDARLAWKPLRGLELSLVGQNLLETGHVEFIQESFGPLPTLIPRSVYFKLEWQF
jgi:iron complex outermembrane receptor protein